jgi:hypothetical protein
MWRSASDRASQFRPDDAEEKIALHARDRADVSKDTM